MDLVFTRENYPIRAARRAGFESTLRSIRRYVARAEELMLAAAREPRKGRMGPKDRRPN